MAQFPPISALFLTHFDDIKGQTILFYSSEDNLPGDDIEHATLPSGLHQLDRDVICFRHHELPGIGVFRSKKVEGGRGRSMGTLGVVLAKPSGVEDLFHLTAPLEDLFDELEDAGSGSAFDLSPVGDDTKGGRSILQTFWEGYRVATNAEQGAGSSRSTDGTGMSSEEDKVRALVEGRRTVEATHPITYLPSLLGVLGPQIIPLYKAALTGKRILIYSPPPLLPLAAFAWCIWAMAIPPAPRSSSISTKSSIRPAGGIRWLGNLGLMDLAGLKSVTRGYVATTSDAIYRSHNVYDIFLDLSTSPPIITSASTQSTPGTKISYTLSDLPLYRSLLLLDSSPSNISILPGIDSAGDQSDEDQENNAENNRDIQPEDHHHNTKRRNKHKHHKHKHHSHSHHKNKDGYISSGKISSSTTGGSSSSIYSRPGGWWLLAFDVFNRAWELCVGVCDYAVGRGGLGRIGDISLPTTEDEELLLGSTQDDDGRHDDGTHGMLDEPEDEAVRRGRLVLRQLHHHSYHLWGRIRGVQGNQADGRALQLSDRQVKELVGAKIWGGAGEAKFWQDLAKHWGLVGNDEGDVEE